MMNNLKKILVISMLLFASCCILNENCLAEEGTTRLTYEQLTKQYPSMEAYVTQTRRRIKNNWYPPVESFENSATIILTINKEGKLLNCYLSIPSTDEAFNNSLIEAAKKSKYAPLPKDVNEESVDIDILFNMQKRTISK